jgi:hypothetical protein
MQLLDIITVVTTAAIIMILVLYVVVVYKKGWLKGDLKQSGTYYRCPNQKCRRVFEEPVWLRDLSQAPPESYQACPHCGFNLQTIPSFISSKPQEQKPITPKLMRSAQDDKQSVENLKRVQLEPSEALSLRSESFRPMFRAARENNPKPANWRPPQECAESPQKQSGSSKILGEKKEKSGDTRNCSHYFGYVKTLPKSTPIPDECMWCPQIVKCLTGTEKIEA